MALVTVGAGGTADITTDGDDAVSFLGLGTLNITGAPGAPINVNLSQLAGVGVLNTINIQDANVTLGGVAGVNALVGFRLGNGARLNVASTASVAAGTGFEFTGDNSVLSLGSAVDLSLLSGGIAGFAPGRAIDVGGVATGLTYDDAAGTGTGGVLTLRDGNGAALGALPLTTGEYTAASFKLSPDGAGGTLVSFPTTVTGVTASPSDAVLGVGGQAEFTVATSAPVTVAGGTPSLSLSDGGTAIFDPAASTPGSLVFRTTVAAGQNAADLAVTGVELNGASVRNGLGIGAELGAAVANPAGTLRVDTLAPAVAAVATTPGAGALSAGQEVAITVTTTEPVTVSGGTPSLLLNDGGTAVLDPAASAGNTLVFRATVAAGQNTPDLAVAAVNLNGAAVADAAGNAADLSGLLTNPPGVLAIDTTAPVVTNVSTDPASGSLAAGQPLVITVSTSEPVSVSGGIPTLALNDGGTATFDPAASTGTGLVFRTTVQPGQSAADLAVTGVNLNGAGVTDGAGNPADLSGAVANPAGTLVVDTTAPTVTGVSTNPSSGTISTGTPVGIVVGTSEPVTVTGGPPTLSLGNGGTATFDPASSTPTGLGFTYVPAFGEDADDLAVTGVNLNGGSVTDAAGNPLDLSGAVTNPPGVLQVVTGARPFLPLSVDNPDAAAVITVSATLRPGAAGTFSNLGNGAVGPDGSTYTVTGTAAEVNAALATVTFAPADGSASVSGYAVSVGDASGSPTVLRNNSALPSQLSPASAGEAVQAGSGSDTLLGGTAPGTQLFGGGGADLLVGSTAGSTMIGGTGSSRFFSGGGNTLIVGRGAADVINAASGTPTVFSAAGGRSLIATGAGPAVVVGAGADTVIGGTGSLLAAIGTGSVAFSGSGPSTYFASGGSTVVGGAGSLLVGVKGDGALVFSGAGPTTFIGGTGSSTVVGGSGGQNALFAGAGGGVFGAGAGGNSTLVGGAGATTLFGGGSGDVLYASGSAGTVLVAGSGNETLQGAYSTGNDTFYAGSGQALIGLGSGADTVFAGSGAATVVAGSGQDVFAFVNGQAGGSVSLVGFKAGTDRIALSGYAAGEAARAGASAVVLGGNTTITLSDNTRITFGGIAGLPTTPFA